MTLGPLVLTPTGLRVGAALYPVTIGRNGITKNKREGDGATPAGTLTITGLLYRPDRIARRLLPPWASPIGPRDLWCDDPGHPAYNHLVRAPFDARHERLRRPDPMYDLILLSDWNWPVALPGLGSAIFIHTWRRPVAPTAGCLALSRANLLRLAHQAPPGTQILIRP